MSLILFSDDLYKIPKVLEKFFDNLNIINYCEDHCLEILPSPQNKTQVMVPIMTGCDKFCTYCVFLILEGEKFLVLLMKFIKNVSIM